jgi:lysyl-tRNA synthetase class II
MGQRCASTETTTALRSPERVVHAGGSAAREHFRRRAGEWLALHARRACCDPARMRGASAKGLRHAPSIVLEHERFLEVETPACVPSPGLDLHLDAFELSRGAAPYLSTSPEYQMKRLLAGGIHRSYQLARCFRVGEEGARHNPEFTMLEWYRAFEGSAALMRDTELLVSRRSRSISRARTRVAIDAMVARSG